MSIIRTEDERILSLLKHKITADVIYDIGASDGCWAWQALQAFPNASIFMFEPLLGLSDVYSSQLAKLLPWYPSLQPHAFAIGDHNGEVDIHITADAFSTTTLQWNGAATTTATTKMRTIDGLVESGMATRPDLIKMDIQGGEMLALKGAKNTLNCVSALLIETWLMRGYGPNTPLLTEIVEFLRPFGFEIFDFGTAFRHADGTLYSIDVCFMKTV
jgi:FkbM family methyltransferase